MADKIETEIQAIMNGFSEGFLDHKTAATVYAIILASKHTGNSRLVKKCFRVCKKVLLRLMDLCKL